MGPKLRLTRTPTPIELGSKSLTAQDSRPKAKASFLFWPANRIPIDETPFGMLQIATPKKLAGEGIKFLKKIHGGSLNHASVYGKSLNNRLKKSHPTSSREPSTSPMINPLSKFVKQDLPEKPRLSTHHNGDPQVSQRERCNLKISRY